LVVFARYNQNDEVNEDEMGRSCNTQGKRLNACTMVGKPEGGRLLGRPGRGGRIILKWIVEKYDGLVWSGLIWLRIGTSGGLL
jgi:hypothetical protein